MDDLISRQAAIDVIEAGRLTKLIDAETAINGLRGLPSAQLEQQWIPVSERLPERGKDVLVTRDYDGRADHIKSCRYVEVASCYGEDDGVSWISYSDEYKMTPKNHCVIAWCELPKPYKEGGADG